MERFKKDYDTKIAKKLLKDLPYTNKHQLPKLVKIVVNRGVGAASQNKKILEVHSDELAIIVGQKPKLTQSKKAIAGFKLRRQVPVGMAAVLRGKRMYAFLDRLVNLALPRIRDFHGINPKSFDHSGNYSLGLDEQLMFPEIQYDKVDQPRGMDITIVTTTDDDDHAFALLSAFGLPFAEKPPVDET